MIVGVISGAVASDDDPLAPTVDTLLVGVDVVLPVSDGIAFGISGSTFLFLYQGPPARADLAGSLDEFAHGVWRSSHRRRRGDPAPSALGKIVVELRLISLAPS
jgi:hypothetical protein